MMETGHSYFLYGSSFFTKLKPVLQEFGTVEETVLGVSPLSELTFHDNGDGKTLTPWLPELDKKLDQCQNAYFVLDLQLAMQKLLATGRRYVAALPENLALLSRKEIAMVDPLCLPEATVRRALQALAAVLEKHFSPEHIILIHTHNSPYWLLGNNLHVEASPAGDKAHSQWLSDLEQHFCTMTGCKYVDVTRFYFYKKETGRPLTNVIYEDECYRDVADRIRSIAAGGSGACDRPGFGYSVDRYVNYYFTMQKKPQRVFLNSSYFLDKLVLSSGPEFLRSNREELIGLDALDWTDPMSALQTMNRLSPKSVVTGVCNAFYAVTTGNYKDPTVDYGLMFRNSVVPEEIISYLKAEFAPKAKLQPVQINRYNAGYHFARMTGLDTASCSTEQTVAEPTVIDIFGSCISRSMFNVQDNDFSVDHYWFHVPPFEHKNKPLKYPEDLFPESPSWTDRLVKKQFDCLINAEIILSKAKWLVLDLYSLLGPNNFLYQDRLFGDFNHRVANTLRAKKVDITKTPELFKNHDEMLKALDPWLQILSSKYRERIILIDSHRKGHWIGDDGVIYDLKRSFDGGNRLWRKAQEYVRKKLDCYFVDISKNFLPDELGYMRNTPAHKEDLGYFAEHDIVRYIVDNMPKQKVFTQYSGKIQMQHLHKLAKNNTLEVLNSVLPLSDLDRAVLALDEDQRECWFEKLAEIYDKCEWSQPVGRILDGLTVDPELAQLLRKTAKSLEKPDELAGAYEPYPQDQRLFLDFSGDCKWPEMPAVKLKKIRADKNFVEISWSAPAQSVVRVYRSSLQEPWHMVGRSETGVFQDKTIQPDGDYLYSLCQEVTQEARVYLGSFTVPAPIHSAPAVVMLIDAVHEKGVNTVTWAPVPNAQKYRIYRKSSLDQRWELVLIRDAKEGTVYTEQSQRPDGGEWYTIRAMRSVDGNELSGEFQPGVCAVPY